MKWYFASRIRHKEALIKIADYLSTKGEIVVSDWLFTESLKPYHENLASVEQLAEGVVSSVLSTDIFVLISDPGGTDMFVELGLALSAQKKNKIYIVGEHSKRSLMQLHPHIIHTDDLKSVFAAEGIDSTGESIDIA